MSGSIAGWAWHQLLVALNVAQVADVAQDDRLCHASFLEPDFKVGKKALNAQD
jgi:hypothetical protein